MTIAYACDLNVYVCVNFRDEILLRGEQCKTRVNLNFFEKKSKMVNCRYSIGCNPEIFLDLGS